MWPWRTRSDQDFAEEIHDHIEREARRLVEEEGLNVAEARARASRSFGNVTHAREGFYERGRLSWLDDLGRDLVYAARTFHRSPGFAAIAILTLALGIGATTAIYSVVDAILLQPLPFVNSDRLVRVVENEVASLSGNIYQRRLSYQQFLDWRARSSSAARHRRGRPDGRVREHGQPAAGRRGRRRGRIGRRGGRRDRQAPRHD